MRDAEGIKGNNNLNTVAIRTHLKTSNPTTSPHTQLIILQCTQTPKWDSNRDLGGPQWIVNKHRQFFIPKSADG